MFYLTLTFALLGVLMVFVLASLIHSASSSQRLSTHRSTSKGFADLLDYASLIEDGLMLCKSGALAVSWKYTCPDADSSTADEKDRLAVQLNQILAKLGDGWVLHIDSVRENVESYSKPSESHFPDEITRAIDEERRRYFNDLDKMYESTFYLTLTYLPPLLAQQKIQKLMFKDNGKKMTEKEFSQKIVDQFKAQITAIESLLSLSVNLTRLKSYTISNEDGSETVFDAQLSYLHKTVTGEDVNIRLPQNAIYLDHLVGCKDFFSGVIPKIDNKFIQCVAIDGLALESHTGILNSLSKISCSCRWNTRFIFLDSHVAVSEIKKYQKKWRQKVRGMIDQILDRETRNVDQNALAMEEDADEFLAEINSGLVGAGYYTSVIVLMDEDRNKLADNARNIAKEIERLGFTARIETINNMEAYFGSLPSNGIANIRRPLINTLNLSDLIPTSSIWTGEKKCPCPFYPENSPALMNCVTDGSSPFRLNIHVRDVGHTLIIGPTGAGKSTHLALLAAQLRRYAGMSIFAFDKGMSMFALNQACNGLHYEIGGEDSTLQFCPLQYLSTAKDRAWATDWIATIMKLNGLEPTPEQNIVIKQAIESMADSGEVSLSSLVTAIQDYEMKQIIEQYAGNSSAVAMILDGDFDNLAFNNFTVFEIEELMNLNDKWKIPVLLYLFKRIEDSLHGQPAAIILDEAWLMLGHPVFREKIREWLKVLRKANCSVIMATQSLSDVANSGILDVIAESTSTKIYLPNSTARDERTAEMYYSLGLNKRQVEIIANAVPKHDYYYVSANGRRLYSLALEKLTLAFVAVSDKESVAKIKELRAEYGEAWTHEWLKLKNINIEDYQ